MIRLVALLLALALAGPAAAQAVGPDQPAGRALVDRLKRGGHVLFFRHADTVGMPCDRSFRVRDRAGQRNISARGREQSARIGRALRDLGVPVETPVLAGPVFRARDTAEIAFGAEKVRVVDSLLADDYAGARLQWVIAEHRRLFNTAPPAGVNRVLVGHRTPAIMAFGPEVGGDAFPEGAALVFEPQPGPKPRLLGILQLAPVAGTGFHGC